jgi:hypothetical protein
LLLASRRSSAIGRGLVSMAREAGWQNPEAMKFLAAGVYGQWNGFDISVRRVPRQKAIPEKVVARVRLQAPARLSIARRTQGFRGGRPITLFGPPLVEMRDGSGGEFWIRTDEMTLAERLFANASIPAMLKSNLVSRFDFVGLSGDTLRIVRANLSSRFGGESTEQLLLAAREELELAGAIIQTLALRP